MSLRFGPSFTGFIALFVAVLLSTPLLAGEGQKIELSAELADVAFSEAELPDGSDMKVYHGVMTGQASDKAGDSDLQEASVHKFWSAYFVEGQDPKVIGNEAYTLPDGSEIYIEFDGLPSSKSEDGKGRGTWRVSGGTGKFEGLTGQGRYTYHPKDESSGTKVLEGEIERQAMTN
jgi:hypothetical protein